MCPQHTTPQDVPIIRCSKCGEEKPATTEYFARERRKKNGLRASCKACNHAYNEANKDKKTEWNRVYSASHKNENTERKRNYRAAHRDEETEQRRLYYAAHKDEKTERRRLYHAANPEVSKAQQQRRRARKQNADGMHTAQDIKDQYKRQKGKCYWCGVKIGDTYHVDHVVPLSRGGSNDKSNLVVACPYCNTSRGARLPHEWPEGGRLL